MLKYKNVENKSVHMTTCTNINIQKLQKLFFYYNIILFLNYERSIPLKRLN